MSKIAIVTAALLAGGTSVYGLLEDPAVQPEQVTETPNPVSPPRAEAPSVSDETAARLGLYRGPSRGPATAPVTIVMFQDSLCPFCEDVLPTIDQLMDEYQGRLRLVI